MIVDEGKYYLYRHVRLDKNEVFYIGIGKKRINSNSIKFIYSRAFCDRRTKFWKNIINKSKYCVEIILESNDYDFIKRKEIEFIKLYGRKDLKKGTLVNLTDGGEGSNKSQFLKDEIREFQRSIAKYGKDNPRSKVIYQYNIEGEFIKEWDSIADVVRQLGNKFKHVVECASGKLKSVGGYQWRYTRTDKIERRKRSSLFKQNLI